MVSGEQEGNFSSLNGNFEIKSLQYLKNSKCRVEFLEGEAIDLDKTILAEESFYIGRVLSASQLEEIKRRSVLYEAERLSVKLVSNYLHSQSALRNKLLKRGYPREICAQVLQRLTDTGYLNDAEYARAWVDARLEKHPEGRLALLAGLKHRGVANGVAVSVLDVVFTPEREQECIREVIARRRERRGLDNEQTVRLLRSRKFSRSMILKVMETLES